jgi:hypothetical protein
MVTVIERELVFSNIPSRISPAPKIACSCQASGRMSSGTSTAAAAKAKSPETTDPKREVHQDRATDPIMRATSTDATNARSDAFG